MYIKQAIRELEELGLHKCSDQNFNFYSPKATKKHQMQNEHPSILYLHPFMNNLRNCIAISMVHQRSVGKDHTK